MSRLSLSFALAFTLLPLAPPAYAQGLLDSRPFRGLFGSGQVETSQALTASASLAGGYSDQLTSDDIFNTGGNFTTTGAPRRGSYGQGSAGLSYTMDLENFSFRSSLGTSGRYYPTGEHSVVAASSAQAAADLSLPKGFSTRGVVSASHQPFLFSPFYPVVAEPTATEIVVPNLDQASSLDYDMYVALEGNVGYSHAFSARTTFSTSYEYRTAFRPGVEEMHFERHRAGASMSRRLTRGLSARGGYTYGNTRYANGDQYPSHGVNVGLDFGRALSLSRRTTLSFSTGSVVVQTYDERRARTGRHFRVIGNARLVHQMGRTWQTYAAYGRNMEFHETWLEPVYSESIVGGVGGLITRRLQFGAGVGTARGTVGVVSSAPGFNNFGAMSQLAFAVSRYVNTMLGYSFYHHRLDESVRLRIAAPLSLQGQSIRVMVSVWAPLYQRARRADVTR